MSADSFAGPTYAIHTGADSAELSDLKVRLNRLERQVIVHMSQESLTCRYHGRDWGKLGWEQGFPRCDSCKQPYRRVQLLLAAGGVVPDAS